MSYICWRMKSIVFLLFALSSHFLIGQSQGYVKYMINIEAIDSSTSTLQSAALLRNSKMELYFYDDNARVDFKMGETFESTLIFNEKENKLLTLSSSPFGKIAVESDSVSYRESLPTKDSSAIVMRYAETKTIIGFECYRLTVELNNNITTYWCTDEIVSAASGMTITDPNITGFPLAFSKVEKGVKMTYRAANYRAKVSDPINTFALKVPKGYILQNASNLMPPGN